MKKITLFSAGGIALAILLVFLTTGAKSNTTLPENTVSETLVADTTAVAETEKIPGVAETTPSAEMTDPPKARETSTPAAQTVKTKTEPEPEEYGLIIGDYHEPTPYSCGAAGHHCEGPETHSYICELEQKGCEYCGSHNCPSFYAVDQWGKPATHRANARNMTSTPIRFITARLVISPAATAKTVLAFSTSSPVIAPTAANKSRHGLATIVNKRSKHMIIHKNMIQCKHCGEIIQSYSVYDFKMCKCGACGVDGGRDYLRRTYTSKTPEEDFIELSETSETEE